MTLLLTPYPWSLSSADYSLLQHLHPGLYATLALFPLGAILIAYDYYPNWRLVFACMMAWAVIAVCFIITAYSAFKGFSPFDDLVGMVVVLSFLWFFIVASLKWAFALPCGTGISYVNELPSQVYGMLLQMCRRKPAQIVKIAISILCALAFGVSILIFADYAWLPTHTVSVLQVAMTIALLIMALSLRWIGVAPAHMDSSGDWGET